MKKMKKFITISLLTLSYISLFSQVEIIFSSGIGTTNIISKSIPGVIDDTYTSGLGYILESAGQFTLFKEHLFLKSGLNFSEKGAYYPIYNSMDGSIIGKRRENVYYLELPIQLQFRFFPLFKLQGGIYNALRLNMKEDEFGSYNSSYVNYDNIFDFGYIYGINLEYKKFIFEVNYSKSINSIGRRGIWDFDLNKIVKSNDTKFYNQTLFFKFGIKIFEFSKKEN